MIFSNHDEAVIRFGRDATIQKDYMEDSPCHPEVFVPKVIGTAPIYVKGKETGLLVSFLDENGKTGAPIKGSYAALNCYYLTKIDAEFAKEKYEKFKIHFRQSFSAFGIKEYHDRQCWFGMDMDAGPIILNLSPSGTAFAIGAATYFNDKKFRNSLLKTAEIAGHTVKWNDQRHYLLGDIALVGEAITLAMRTNYK